MNTETVQAIFRGLTDLVWTLAFVALLFIVCVSGSGCSRLLDLTTAEQSRATTIWPAGPKLSGGFLQLDWATTHQTPAQWEKTLTNAKAWGCQILVFQALKPDDGSLDAVLTACDRLRLSYFLGLASTTTNREADLLSLAAQAQSLADRYSDHPYWIGWYLPYEFDEPADWKPYVTQITSTLHKVRNLPVAMAPCQGGELSTLEWYWAWFLSGRTVDILMVQDGCGARGTDPSAVVAACRAFYNACTITDTLMWGDIEAFDQAGGKLVPTTPEKFRARKAALAPFCTRLVAFDLFHFLTPATPTLYKEAP